MEDRDDPAPLADLENNGRVVRILVMPRNPTTFRDPAFALKHGIAELEDVAGQASWNDAIGRPQTKSPLESNG